MDTSDPEIVFDSGGVCNHCYQFDKAWAEVLKQRNSSLDIPRSKGRFDVLIGLSGGVDSSLALHYLIERGLRPLAFSIDNGWNTPEADENIMRLVETLKVPFFRYTIDIDKFKNLQWAFVQSGTPNIEIPTDHILMAASYELARKHNIKTIISGGNVATEGVMPKEWGYNARDLKFIQSVAKWAGVKIKGYPTISIWRYLYLRFLRGIRVINILDYYDYDRAAAIELLEQTYGYKPYGEKHCESKFTKWFQEYYLIHKFGYDKRRAHYSSLINSGQMSRTAAIESLQPFPMNSGCFWKLPLEKRTHRDFPNQEWLWNSLSRLYAFSKK